LKYAPDFPQNPFAKQTCILPSGHNLPSRYATFFAPFIRVPADQEAVIPNRLLDCSENTNHAENIAAEMVSG